ncbi:MULTISPECIES: DUF1800 family protein [Myxococcaceae]|uniref:DUF1800 domain-containing protein n=1 Tax=Myxococcaceae TaxID=31 RepID=UPI001E474AE7|nr:MULTISPECIES: DUF1800 domain-containing protein [Myxococcaceae]
MRSLPLLALLGVTACAASRPLPPAAPPPPFDAERALHALERLAYGPSARDLEAVRRVGVDAWVDGQLRPGGAPPPALAARLAAFPTLAQSPQQLLESFPPRGAAAERDGEEGGRARLPWEERPRRIVEELATAKLVRAVESERPLEEVLVDFWFNHFNVSADKGAVRWLVTSYERDAIRPHVYGKFRDLLGAVAHHPAMLFYLDNWQSTREGFARGGARAPTGLNENYARELLELHTLGVDGGYTQQDVREVARCFTGWSLRAPRREPAFVFRAAAHDPGAKRVLGHEIDAGGARDGEAVLDLLARQPATAHLVALKLARRFVSDAPPEALVERVARVFLDTGGDLPSVYRALFHAPEFWAPEARGAKTKTPLEFVASALRATDARVESARPLLAALARMGQPLYRAPAPTGFADRAQAWVSSGSLVARVNFGLALASGRLPGVHLPEGGPPPATDPDALALALLHRPLSSATRDTLLAALQAPTAATGDALGPPPPAPLVAGLLLGSPEFQKR